jgi:phosphoglycolate phosphatase
MRLVLFDIDGTILSTEGAGRRAMEGALRAQFGTAGAPSYRYDGKTDLQIVRDLLRAAGVDDDTIDAQLPALLDDYLARLDAELSHPAHRTRVYDGVRELIAAVEARADLLPGLLTGNVEQGAHRKLRAAAIEPSRFRVGAFGSDHAHRPELAAIALARWRAMGSHEVPGDRLVIIGDTPHDIHCGRGVGARAIAVATGHYSVTELASHDPVAVFADLRDTAAVLEAIVAA